MAALARRMRTVAEMKRPMRARLEDPESEYSETLVELVIRRLKDQGYLNDSQYAVYYSSMRRDNQKVGRRPVITELKTAGSSGSVIDKAVEALTKASAMRSRPGSICARSAWKSPRIGGSGANLSPADRAGFASKTIFAILKKWDVEDEVLSALEEEISE